LIDLKEESSSRSSWGFEEKRGAGAGSYECGMDGMVWYLIWGMYGTRWWWYGLAQERQEQGYY